ncbi:MAG: hypothetical protein EOM53_06085 [Alphaproteobacteria bacterium]|nr:hypothetical protein [Alphaproteobacteria bacterium]
METPKIVWGYSLKELQRARVNADKKSYICTFQEAYSAILTLDRSYPSKPLTEKFYDVFMKDPIRGVVVVMGVSGNVDTTEVGIFLTENKDNTLVVEVVSSSRLAQSKVSQALFEELDKRFL